jgi:hypothetical protein
MKLFLLTLLLAATPSTAFFRPNNSETDPPAEEDRDHGESDYAIPHLFFKPNNDVGTVDTTQLASGAPSDTPTISAPPSNPPSSETPTMSPSEVPSDTPTVTNPPTKANNDEDENGNEKEDQDEYEDEGISSGAPSDTPSEALSVTPSAAPSAALSETPSLAPTVDDITISDATLPATLNEARTSKHRYQWGATYEGCDHDYPPVYLSCGGGGLLTSIVDSDAECEQLSLDRAQCNSTHLPQDEDGSYVDFHCTGVTSTHLTATAEVFPSTAKNCDTTYDVVTNSDGEVVSSRGGNAALFGVLGRVCTMNNGRDVVENIYDCNKGVSGQQGDSSYCAAGAMCAVDEICSSGTCTGDSSCSASLDAMSMSNADDREACSTVEATLDLVGATFAATSLGSFYDVEWTFSGMALGCQAVIPDVTFECKNGGQAKLGGTYSYCLEQGSTITCTTPNGPIADMRESLFLKIWCHGESYDQLELSADLPELNDNSAMCAKEGVVVQGLRIRKGCWNDELVSLPSFCADSSQVFADSNLCYAGYFCSAIYCEGQQIEVPAVSAITSDPATRTCVRAA